MNKKLELIILLLISIISIIGISLISMESNINEYGTAMSKKCYNKKNGGRECVHQDIRHYKITEGEICKYNKSRRGTEEGTKFRNSKKVMENIIVRAEFYIMLESEIYLIPIFQISAFAIYLI